MKDLWLLVTIKHVSACLELTSQALEDLQRSAGLYYVGNVVEHWPLLPGALAK